MGNDRPDKCPCKGLEYPFSRLPYLPEAGNGSIQPPAPDDAECFRLWLKYEMPDNIRAHSLAVAYIATQLAQRAFELKMPVSVPETRASALLHDLAKIWCIHYGGSHAMLGGAWAVMETGNYRVAQGVILHVQWPWRIPENQAICALPFFVYYADKRVRHDACVTLDERFEDLLTRYGINEAARCGIRHSWKQAIFIEGLLAKYLGWDLHENTFDCGRLV